MSRLAPSRHHQAHVTPAPHRAPADADPHGGRCLRPRDTRATLDGPLALGAEARIVFRTGLRLRFRVVEFEPNRLFTDESRLPGGRMGHRHLIEPTPDGGSRLTNTIYIEGPLAPLWRRIMGPPAARALPAGQQAAVDLARSS